MIFDRTALRFAASFAGIALVLFAIYCFPYAPGSLGARWLRGYLEAYAHMAGGVLGVFEHGVTVHGTLISGKTTLEIARNCDAIEVNTLFTSAVLAFPARCKARLLGVTAGLAALVAANLIRIVSLYYLLAYAPSWFETAHLELWPLVLVAAATVTFLGWIRWQRSDPVAGTPSLDEPTERPV